MHDFWFKPRFSRFETYVVAPALTAAMVCAIRVLTGYG